MLLPSVSFVVALKFSTKININTQLATTKLFIELKEDEKILIDLLNNNSDMSMDLLCLKSNLSLTKVAASLLNLEFSGVVKSLPGKIYKLI